MVSRRGNTFYVPPTTASRRLACKDSRSRQNVIDDQCRTVVKNQVEELDNTLQNGTQQEKLEPYSERRPDLTSIVRERVWEEDIVSGSFSISERNPAEAAVWLKKNSCSQYSSAFDGRKQCPSFMQRTGNGAKLRSGVTIHFWFLNKGGVLSMLLHSEMGMLI